MASCAESRNLLSLRSEDLDPAEAQALSAHLADCAACRTLREESAAVSRKLVAGAKALETSWPLRPKRSFLPWAAAAAVLLTAVLFWPPKPQPSLPSAPVQAPSRELLAGRSALVTLAEGASARVAGATVRLERGTLRIESPGEKVTLEAGALRVELSDGELLAEVRPARAAWLLRDAWASESEVRLTLVRGSARFGERILKGGESLGPPLSWPETGSWKSLPPSTGILLPAPPSRYVFEALVRKRQDSAEIEAVFTADGKGWSVPVGANLMSAGEGWWRLRVSVDASSSRVLLGEREVACYALSALSHKLLSNPSQGVGLKVWGGVVEVRDARWRPLP